MKREYKVIENEDRGAFCHDLAVASDLGYCVDSEMTYSAGKYRILVSRMTTFACSKCEREVDIHERTQTYEGSVCIHCREREYKEERHDDGSN